MYVDKHLAEGKLLYPDLDRPLWGLAQSKLIQGSVLLIYNATNYTFLTPYLALRRSCSQSLHSRLPTCQRLLFHSLLGFHLVIHLPRPSNPRLRLDHLPPDHPLVPRL